MKFLLTFLALLFTICSFSQIQLDSIIQISNDSGLEIYQHNFRYDNGILQSYELDVNDIANTLYEVEYNDQGQIGFISKGYVEFLSTKLFITRNDDGQLEAVNIQAGEFENYLGKYEYESDQLISFTFSDVASQSEVLLYSREHVYDENSESITSTDILNGNIQFSRNLVFDEQERLVKWKEDASGVVSTDSLVYSNDCLEDILRFNANLGEYQDLLSYTCNGSLDYTQISNPAELLTFINDYFAEELNHILLPIQYGIQVESSDGIFDSEDSTTDWYYSAITSANERVEAIPFSVYPNPTSDLIRLELEENLVQYSIYDMNGQVVRSQKMENDQLISVESLTTGSYTIVANTKDEAYYFAQFIKQ